SRQPSEPCFVSGPTPCSSPLTRFSSVSPCNLVPGGAPRDSHGPFQARGCGSRRADELRTGWYRHVSSGRRLHRSNPQRRQARRSTGHAVDQVRAGDQSQNGESTRPPGAGPAAGAYRRGDRVIRREFITLLGGVAGWPLAGHAQQPKLPTIGYLGVSTASSWRDWTAAFVRRLGELGWTEG